MALDQPRPFHVIRTRLLADVTVVPRHDHLTLANELDVAPLDSAQVGLLDVFVAERHDRVGLAVVIAKEAGVATAPLEPGDVFVGTGHLVGHTHEGDVTHLAIAVVFVLDPIVRVENQVEPAAHLVNLRRPEPKECSCPEES